MASKGRPKTLTAACWITFIGTVITIIAFSTPYWLATDGILKNPKFLNLGLWEFCLQNYQDRNHLYDKVFSGCRYIFDEEYWIIHDELMPPFFICVQIFYTTAFTLMLAASGMVIMLLLCVPEDVTIAFMRVIGLTLVISAILASTAVIVFAAMGDSRDFMPDWWYNWHSWSFGLAVVGNVAKWVAGVLFLLQAKRTAKKEGIPGIFTLNYE